MSDKKNHSNLNEASAIDKNAKKNISNDEGAGFLKDPSSAIVPEVAKPVTRSVEDKETQEYVGSVLDEIVLRYADGSTVFNEYDSKYNVGLKIFKELHKRFDKKRNGFIMDDISKGVGILSQCQSLQAWVSLALDFGLDFDKTDYVKNQKGSIREIMDFVIEDLVSRIIIKEDGKVKYIFDASPYTPDESNYFTDEIANIDAITWIIPSFLTILKYHADHDDKCKWEDELVEVIKYGLDYLVRADVFLDGKLSVGEKNSNGKEPLKLGWNFTKDCSEPSLYYTFAVGECFLDMYEIFKDVLAWAFEKENAEEYGFSPDKKLEEGHKEKLEKGHEYYYSYNELVRIYKRICDIGENDDVVVHGKIFGVLSEKLRKAARAVWNCVKDDLADNFFYNDLATTLSEKDIMMSTTSDALFNTVYIVNIMVDGGVDEYYALKCKAARENGDYKTAEDAQREYDNLLESCMLAVQKAFRTYEKLKDQSKDYIVDQFLIGFNEKFNAHKALVGELRKLRMKTFSLLPMLIHTNNIISEYLIKYPHYNMTKYLEYILENRYKTTASKTAHWIWEKDGFFSGSNCYFVVALNEFYNYYDKYEKEYIAVSRGNEEHERSIIDAHEAKQKAPGGEISNLVAERDSYLAELVEKRALIEELEGKVITVDDAVKSIVENMLSENIVAFITKAFTNAGKALTLDSVDATEDVDGKYSHMFDAFISMIVSKYMGAHYSTRKSKNKPENYDEHFNKSKIGVDAIFAEIVTDAKHSVDGTGDEPKNKA